MEEPLLHLRQRLTTDAAAGAGEAPAVDGVLTLSFHERRHSRRRVRLDDGREAALLLPRGTVLADGDRLRADEGGGLVVRVRAAPETLSVARTADPHRLTRAAYHLGNRHVPLQIGAGWLAWEHDHVLDDLVRELGLAVTSELRPFHPEAGAHAHPHPRAHAHDEAHAQAHAHDQVHAHPHDQAQAHAHAHADAPALSPGDDDEGSPRAPD